MTTRLIGSVVTATLVTASVASADITMMDGKPAPGTAGVALSPTVGPTTGTVVVSGGGPAVQEDVDAIGLSIMSGAHMTLFPAVLDLLKEKKAQEIKVFGGGIIPPAGVPFDVPGTTNLMKVETV